MLSGLSRHGCRTNTQAEAWDFSNVTLTRSVGPAPRVMPSWSPTPDRWRRCLGFSTPLIGLTPAAVTPRALHIYKDPHPPSRSPPPITREIWSLVLQTSPTLVKLTAGTSMKHPRCGSMEAISLLYHRISCVLIALQSSPGGLSVNPCLGVINGGLTVVGAIH